MDYSTLKQAVAEDAAIRRRQRLQPVGGQGDKIFPPTYPGEGRNPEPRHVFERRRINGEDVWCVLVDSVQSQANRLEEALLAAIADRIPIPHISVDFSKAGLTGIDKITSLDAPHRVYDAILRDSRHNGEEFPNSAPGKRLTEAKPRDASALLEISPTALVFGAWYSTGEGGGLGAKFPRALVSEIAAFNVSVEEQFDPQTGEVIDARSGSRRSAIRIDPLGIISKVPIHKGEGNAWDIAATGLDKPKKAKPSEVNHGNIITKVQALGVTCDYAEQTAVISFAGLRRLGFRGGERDAAGRAYLAALGLLALAELDARGYALRSRCDLVCEGLSPLEIVHPDGRTDAVALDRAAARALYAAAFDAARAAGFDLDGKPLVLTPQAKLVDIVKQSELLAREGKGGDESEAAKPAAV